MKSCSHIPWLYLLLGGLITTLLFAYFFQWDAVLGVLPWLLLLACPLMHLFHGHGNHDHSHQHKDQ